MILLKWAPSGDLQVHMILLFIKLWVAPVAVVVSEAVAVVEILFRHLLFDCDCDCD